MKVSSSSTTVSYTHLTNTEESVLLPEPFGPIIACTSPGFTVRLIPVSYTHLDVYKRQVSTRGWEVYPGSGAEDYFEPAVAITGRYTAVTSSFHVWRKVVDVFLVQQLIAQISLIKSVSYTHLIEGY